MTFIVRILPATFGDSILIRYGSGAVLNNVLIDGGTGGTKKYIKKFIEDLPANERHFELVVVTHVDKDHIQGLLSLLSEDTLNFSVGDFWFNGYKHLSNNVLEEFGPQMGEKLSLKIQLHKIPWNKAFGGGSISIDDADHIPERVLDGGLRIKLLSPYRNDLERLKPVWEKKIIEEGLMPGFGDIAEEVVANEQLEGFGATGIPNIEELNTIEFLQDDAEANGSSIALLVSYGDKTILLAGDAFPENIVKSLDKLFYKERVNCDLVKLSHHGSEHNTSPELIEKLNCSKFVFSTNGSIYKHPSKPVVAWVIKRSQNTELYFNYRTRHNEIWNSSVLKPLFDYKTYYPENDQHGLELHI